MVIATAKEIIDKAKYFGNVRNSNTNDFDTCTTLLNNEYLDIYYDIVKETDAFAKYIEFSGEQTSLPSDCYMVLGVYIKGTTNNGIYHPITPSPKNQFVPSEYKIENNTIRVISSTSSAGKYVVKYAPNPATITAPDDMVLLSGISGTVQATQAIDDDNLYMLIGDQYYIYTISTKTLTATGDTPSMISSGTYSATFVGGTVTATYNKDGTMSSVVTYTDSSGNVTYPFAITGKTINYFQSDDPYAIVSYTDGTIYIFTGTSGVLWNQLAYTGHNTLGKVIYIYTDDTTGKGVIFYNNRTNSYYYCSFVPDTVFSYPTNVFFQLLEYRLGSTMAAILGMSTQYLNTVLIPRAEKQFYESLKKDQYLPTRIMNTNENYQLL